MPETLLPALLRRDRRGFWQSDLPALRHAMYRAFDDPFFRRSFSGPAFDALPVDVSERDGDLVVRASLPGFSREEIDVQVHNGVLAITATHDETTEEQHEDGERFYRRERRSGAVSRRITLPAAVRDAEVEGELKDGVLTLTIPTPEEAKPKQIEIKG